MSKFLLITGPCSVESELQLKETAQSINKHLKPDYFRAGIWKPRTRPGSFEGIGIKGLKWLQNIQSQYKIPVLTEVGSAKHIEKIAKYDINSFWIGARTVSNPFSVQEIVDATKNSDFNVFIKNPIYPDIELWTGAIERFLNIGVKNLFAIHRGFYPFEKTVLRNIPRWEIPIELSRRFPNLPIICDPSHIAGKTSFIKDISQKAIDLNMSGLMLESHYKPSIALSDKDQQLKPIEIKQLFESLNFRSSSKENQNYILNLENLREKIDVIDYQLIDMLEHRFKLVDEIGKLKKDNNVVILQLERWRKIIESRLDYSNPDNITKDFLLKILQMIHKESIQRQNNIMNNSNKKLL